MRDCTAYYGGEAALDDADGYVIRAEYKTEPTKQRTASPSRAEQSEGQPEDESLWETLYKNLLLLIAVIFFIGLLCAAAILGLIVWKRRRNRRIAELDAYLQDENGDEEGGEQDS